MYFESIFSVSSESIVSKAKLHSTRASYEKKVNEENIKLINWNSWIQIIKS
jgi:hypothetical protein